MKLTERNKQHIDGLSYEELLRKWRFTSAGTSPWFEGETGEYWCKRMTQLREGPGGQARHVRASKKMGWGCE